MKHLIKKFEKIDFNLYKEYFPKYFDVILSFIFMSICLVLLVLNIIIIICLKKDKDEDIISKLIKLNKIASIIIYIPSFLTIFIFCLIYCSEFNDNSKENAKSIKADKFIEDFLKDFIKVFENKTLIICSITLLSLSALLFIIGMIFGKLIYCKDDKKFIERGRRIRPEYFNRYGGDDPRLQRIENRRRNIILVQNLNRLFRNTTNSNYNQNTDNNPGTNVENKVSKEDEKEDKKEENLEEIII